jgi:hypothetical protein
MVQRPEEPEAEGDQEQERDGEREGAALVLSADAPDQFV